jgi:hypothetical protein
MHVRCYGFLGKKWCIYKYKIHIYSSYKWNMTLEFFAPSSFPPWQITFSLASTLCIPVPRHQSAIPTTLLLASCRCNLLMTILKNRADVWICGAGGSLAPRSHSLESGGDSILDLGSSMQNVKTWFYFSLFSEVLAKKCNSIGTDPCSKKRVSKL